MQTSKTASHSAFAEPLTPSPLHVLVEDARKSSSSGSSLLSHSSKKKKKKKQRAERRRLPVNATSHSSMQCQTANVGSQRSIESFSRWESADHASTERCLELSNSYNSPLHRHFYRKTLGEVKQLRVGSLANRNRAVVQLRQRRHLRNHGLCISRLRIKRSYFTRACFLVVPLITTHLQFSELGEEFGDFQQLLE